MLKLLVLDINSDSMKQFRWNTIQQYKINGSNGYRQVKKMEILMA